jgi:hypothetical protein
MDKNETETKPETTAKQETNGDCPAASCVRLYEITAMISRSVVIAATSKQDALSHVETWEDAWEAVSELIGVSDVDLNNVRDVKTDNWNDEANQATCAANILLRDR